LPKGQRELIDTLTQLLSPLGNNQGLNTNGGNGQTRFHAEGSNSGAPDNGQTDLRQKGATTELQWKETILMCPGKVCSRQ
jgi:hypothetical protein